MDEDDFGPDPNDKLFDELDDMVSLAEESLGVDDDSDKKFDVSLNIINLMLEEVPENARISQQDGGGWIAEVKYRGINFIHVNGKHKPQLWDDVFQKEDEE